MSPANLYADDSSSPADLARIIAACERFEADWNAGLSRWIENEVAAAPEPIRARLFRELLALELELARRGGQAVPLDEYLARFPDRADAVREVFIGATLSPPDPEVTWPRSYEETSDCTRRLRAAPHARRGGPGDDLPGARPRLATAGRAQALSRGRLARAARGGAQRGPRAGASPQSASSHRASGSRAGATRSTWSWNTSPAGRSAELTAEERADTAGCCAAGRAGRRRVGRGSRLRPLAPRHQAAKHHPGRRRRAAAGRLRPGGARSPARPFTRSAALPAYMAPEQARGQGERVDARTDVYGLGAVSLLPLDRPAAA